MTPENDNDEIEKQMHQAARSLIDAPVKPSELVEVLAGPFGRVVRINEVGDDA